MPSQLAPGLLNLNLPFRTPLKTNRRDFKTKPNVDLNTTATNRLTNALKVVYHLPKISGNFGRDVNGKINFVSPNGNIPGKTGFLERYVDQNSQTEFQNGKRAFHFSSFY